jgi:hypothetical protein
MMQVESAAERYERQVHTTMKKLVSNNEIQMHPLQPLDSIKSICMQHRIGANPRASDIAGGFKFKAVLPQKYDREGLSVSRDYEVIGEASSSEQRRDPKMRVRYTDPVSGDQKEIIVPRSVIRVAASVRDESESMDVAQEKFASELRYSAISALRDISTQLDRSGHQLAMPDFNADEPLIPQIAGVLYRGDFAAFQRDITRGIKSIGDSMVDANIDEDLAPDERADSFINNKLVHALTIVAEASSRVGMGGQFSDLVTKAFGGADDPEADQAYGSKRSSMINRIRLASTGQLRNDSDAEEAKEIIDQVVEIGEQHGVDKDQTLRGLVHSVNESLSIIVRAVNGRNKVAKMRAERHYEENLVGLDIPVPSRALLVPGSTVTVVPVKRNLNRITRDNLKILGVTPNMLISDPLLGLVAAIEYAAYARGLMPTLDLLAEDLSQQFASRMLSSLAPQVKRADGKVFPRVLTTAENARVLSIAKDSLTSLLMSPIDPRTDDMQRAERKAVLGTYRKISSIIENAEIGTINEENMASAEANADSAASGILQLRNAMLDRSARAITSNEGAKSLHEVAPCTAVMLNRLAFGPREMTLYNILVPPTEEALKFMTADFFREAMTGVQKTGKDVIFSREVDKIAVSMRVLNDFYMDFMAEVDREESKGKAVLTRLSRKYSSEDKDSAKIARSVAAALGVTTPNASRDSLERAAEQAADRIIEEMSSLSDTSRNNRVIARATKIVEDALGSDRSQIYVRAGAERQYDECVRLFTNWIGNLDAITAQDAAKIVASSPQSAVDYGVPQMIDKITHDAVAAVYNRYVSESETAIYPYTSRK